MGTAWPAIAGFTKDLVREGLLSPDQLTIAQVSQENLGEDLCTILLKKGFVSEEKLLQFLSTHLKVPVHNGAHLRPDQRLVRKFSLAMAQRFWVLPVRTLPDGKIEVAMANPLDPQALDELRQTFKAEIIPFLASPAKILGAIQQAHHKPATANHQSNLIETVTEVTLDETKRREIEEMASGSKIISVVNEMLAKAWKESASDIHLEPGRKQAQVRYRIDGVLKPGELMPRNIYLACVSRIKIMSGLDIAEHRIPQDGRIRIRMVGRSLDLRISTCPSQFGEKVVMRLLPQEEMIGIEELGMSVKDRQLFLEMVQKSHGLVLVTGPTGSGKSTTLYAAIKRIYSPEINIVTIEDPIECEVEGITQIAVHPKIGLTFAGVLRSVLRQDPDVIMIGEIRDAETAKIAVQAAITGHLVLSTLHTNTAVGAISRLLDLGVEPFLLSTALRGAIAQRLVRKICPECRQERKSSIPPRRQFEGKGCATCEYSGYRGRIGIFELAPVDEEVQRMIYQRATDAEIEKKLRSSGIESLGSDGVKKIESGETTLEEVLRVTEET